MVNIEKLNYESYLKDLKQLIISFEVVDSKIITRKEKEKLLSRLKDNYNKLYLYEFFYGKNLIAVTGLQGAGKTTLVRELFELPEGILPENNSRGEKLPVFISEGNVEKIYTSRVFVETEGDDYKIKKEEVTPEVFQSVSIEPNEKEDLWLECIVPANILNDENKVIALLPGYEKSKKDFSQKLLDFVVHMSKFSIIVLNKNTYARQSTNTMIKKIEEEFEGLSPIIAMTHGDQNPEQNEDIRQSIIEDMSITDPYRVITTGSKNIIGDKWQDDIATAINSLWAENKISKRGNESLHELFDALDMNIEDTRNLLEETEENSKLNMIIESTMTGPVENFRNQYEKYLGKLEQSLRSKIEILSIDDEDLLNLVENYTGFLKSIKKLFPGNDLKESIKFKKDIQKIWIDDYKVNKKLLSASNQLMFEQLGRIEFDEQSTNNNLLEDFITPPNISDRKNSTSDKPEGKNVIEVSATYEQEKINSRDNFLFADFDFQKLDQSVTNINRYFLQNLTKNSNTNSNLTSLKKEDYDVLVFMGAQFLNNTAISLERSALNNQNSISEEELESLKLNIGKHTVKDDSSLGVLKKSMMAVPVILGLDVMVDGEADILQNILLSEDGIFTDVSFAGVQMTAGVLAGISMGALAIASAAFVVNQVMKDVNASQINKFNNANFIVEQLKETQVKSYIQNQRTIFEKMEDKLVQQEGKIRGRDELVGQLDELIYIANRLYSKVREVRAHSYDKTFLF